MKQNTANLTSLTSTLSFKRYDNLSHFRKFSGYYKSKRKSGHVNENPRKLLCINLIRSLIFYTVRTVVEAQFPNDLYNQQQKLDLKTLV